MPDLEAAPIRNRPLLTHLALWVISPLVVAVLGLAAVSLIVYQQALTTLVVARDHQLAELAASQIANSLAGYRRVLTTLAASDGIRSPASTDRRQALADAAPALDIFPGGVFVVDPQGAFWADSADFRPPFPASIADQRFFRAVLANRAPAVSDAIVDDRTGRLVIAIAVPILDEDDAVTGLLMGLVPLDAAAFGELIGELRIGEAGYAYLVDGTGRVIYHPNSTQLGQDFTDRPFVQAVIAGQTGGTTWTSPSGERLVQGYAPVTALGWGVVVREPWDAVAAPAQAYVIIILLVSGVLIAGVTYLLWRGILRIVRPVGELAMQTQRLATNQPIDPVARSQIKEVDTLSHNFNQMARQITSYRAGLRRYVGALTQLQEEERRRIARDLHDETVQDLLALNRRLELLRTASDPEELHDALADLQAFTASVVQGVRRISQDLRPALLDDLGFTPALRALVRDLRHGLDAVPESRLTVDGPEFPLRPELELALYRIAQEALANVRKHARAMSAQVTLSFQRGAVRLTVADDGVGFTLPESYADLTTLGHYGLMGIHERVWAAGGELQIESRRRAGTRLTVAFPIQPAVSPEPTASGMLPNPLARR